MSVAKEFEAANVKYASTFENPDLSLSPTRKVIVVTFIDSRIDVYQALGLREGEAHVIRNAGGRVSDSLRSIIISQQLAGTREIVILHPTGCGMLFFTDDVMRAKVRTELNSSADHIDFLPFADLKESVLDDIKFLKDSPLVLDVPISGYLYEVEIGRIVKV